MLPALLVDLSDRLEAVEAFYRDGLGLPVLARFAGHAGYDGVMLGLPGGPGLMDALAKPDIDVADCVIGTDISGLWVLPAGNATTSDSEYLSSSRTDAVLERLTQEILDLIMTHQAVRYAEVEVDKPHALRFAESVSITLAGHR